MGSDRPSCTRDVREVTTSSRWLARAGLSPSIAAQVSLRRNAHNAFLLVHDRIAAAAAPAGLQRIYGLARCSLASLASNAVGFRAPPLLRSAAKRRCGLHARRTSRARQRSAHGMDGWLAPLRICRCQETSLSDSRALDTCICRPTGSDVRFRERGEIAGPWYRAAIRAEPS